MSKNITRRTFLKAAGTGLTGAVLLGTTGCNSGQNGQSTSSAVTVSQPADASTLDPQKQGTVTDMNLLINMFDTLTTRDKDNNLAPALATDWKALDKTSWRFKLRKGVKFHDGEPFNAGVVKYSIERILNPKTKSPIVEMSSVKRVEVVNDYTVDFILSEPDPILPNQLSLFAGAMVPPQYIQKKGADHFAAHPVGTGPWQFVQWQRGNQVVMKAYDNYWRGAPKIKQLTFRNIPSPADALSAVKVGEVDIVTTLTPDNAAQLEGVQNAGVIAVPGIRVYFIPIDTLQGGPLANKKVRQALNYAVDVKQIAKTVLGGYASQVATLVPSQNFGYDPHVRPYEHNPEKAKQLLAQAGYGQGFTVGFNALNEDSSVAQAIAGQLKKVGVNAHVSLLDSGTFEQSLLTRHSNKLAALYLVGNTAWTMDAESNFQSFVQYSDTQSRWKNARASQLVSTEETSVDQSKRKQADYELQRLLKDEAPFIYLYQMDNIYAMSTRVRWKPGPIGMQSMYGASIRKT